MLTAKLDENMPKSHARLLRDGGVDVCTVPEEGLSGSNDTEVASAARTEGRVLVTMDLDFANILRFPPGTHPGIVVLRPKSEEAAALAALAEPTRAALASPASRGALIVIDPSGTRARRADA